MDIMPRAGMVSPPPATGGGGGETRPDTGQLVDPPSMTFGFPFVPLRDDNLFLTLGATTPWWPTPDDT
jgi:hypothetical protein